MRRRAGTVAGLLGTALLVLAAPAGAIVKKVDIEPTKFTPAVITVGPGTDVEWTNKDGRTRALRGDFSSTDIVPGQTYKRRFSRIGRFDYRDRDNPLLTGTVIVTVIYAGGRPRYPRPGGTGLVTHHWRGTLRLDIREDWKYMDGKFLSFAGPCNAQVGDGSRQAQFSAAFPDVKYSRVGGLEVLAGSRGPTGSRATARRSSPRPPTPTRAATSTAATARGTRPRMSSRTATTTTPATGFEQSSCGRPGWPGGGSSGRTST